MNSSSIFILILIAFVLIAYYLYFNVFELMYNHKIHPLINKYKKEFSMVDDNGLRNPGELFEEKFNKVAVEQGLKIEVMADVFLGEIRSNGAFVRIVCRDHEYPDGDLVQVKVNDDIIIPRLLLTGGYKGFNVTLNVGSNRIEFLALNQGDSGPNTAEFIVYNDDGAVVSSKKWNLLTGVKASVIVLKDANPITEKEHKMN